MVFYIVLGEANLNILNVRVKRSLLEHLQSAIHNPETALSVAMTLNWHKNFFFFFRASHFVRIYFVDIISVFPAVAD